MSLESESEELLLVLLESVSWIWKSHYGFVFIGEFWEDNCIFFWEASVDTRLFIPKNLNLEEGSKRENLLEFLTRREGLLFKAACYSEMGEFCESVMTLEGTFSSLILLFSLSASSFCSVFRRRFYDVSRLIVLFDLLVWVMLTAFSFDMWYMCVWFYFDKKNFWFSKEF